MSMSPTSARPCCQHVSGTDPGCQDPHSASIALRAALAPPTHITSSSISGIRPILDSIHPFSCCIICSASSSMLAARATRVM